MEEHSQPYVDTWDFPSSLTPLTSLSLSMNETTAYTGMPMNTITITPNGCFKEIIVEPSLGSSFTMDLEDPKINTQINGVVKSVFTVTAKGDAGTASATLTVNFRKCGADRDHRILKTVMITKNYGNEQAYTLKNKKTGEVIASGSGFAANKEYTNTYCVPVGEYVALLTDSYGDGWTTGSFLRLYDEDDSLIQEFTIEAKYDRTATSYTGYFSVVSSSVTSIWRAMLDKEPKKGWNAIDFDDSAWMETTSDVYYQNWSQNTIYFRYELNVTDSIKYPVVEYGIWYKDGIIIYLNGEEVCRRNMPSGTIRHNTMASATFVGYYQRVGSAPGYLLRDGKNVIAVEIHRHDSTSGEIQFSGYVKAIQGNCVSRVSGGTITESSFYNRPDYSAAQAWDGLETTEWIENGSPAWTVYSYNFDRMEWVNRFVLVSSSNGERDPKEFHLYGSRDGMNWEELLGSKWNSFNVVGGEDVARWVFELYGYENVSGEGEGRRLMRSNSTLLSRTKPQITIPLDLNGYRKIRYEIIESANDNTIGSILLAYCSGSGMRCVGDERFPSVGVLV